MAFIIQPFQVAGALRCIDPLTKRTDFFFSGVAQELPGGVLEIYKSVATNTDDPNDPNDDPGGPDVSGAVEFGVT